MAPCLKVPEGRASHSISIGQSEGASQENVSLIKWVGLGISVRKRGAQCRVGAGKGSLWSVVYGLGVGLFHPVFCRPEDG